MSLSVDLDSCPCKECKDMSGCDNDIVPWCEKYATWYMKQQKRTKTNEKETEFVDER